MLSTRSRSSHYALKEEFGWPLLNDIKAYCKAGSSERITPSQTMYYLAEVVVGAHCLSPRVRDGDFE